MTDQQRRFCDEYINGFSARDAAKKAGYADGTAKDASRWINKEIHEKRVKTGKKSLYKPELREYIDKTLEETHSEKIVGAEEWFERLSSYVRKEGKEQVLRFVAPGKQEVAEIDVPTKETLRAFELMGKALGVFKDSVELTGTAAVIIKDDLKE